MYTRRDLLRLHSMNCEKLTKNHEKNMKPFSIWILNIIWKWNEIRPFHFMMLDIKFPILLSRRKKYQLYLQTIFYAFKYEKVRWTFYRKIQFINANDVNWFVVKWFNFFIKVSVFFGVIVINDFDYKNNTIINDAKMAWCQLIQPTKE